MLNVSTGVYLFSCLVNVFWLVFFFFFALAVIYVLCGTFLKWRKFLQTGVAEDTMCSHCKRTKVVGFFFLSFYVFLWFLAPGGALIQLTVQKYHLTSSVWDYFKALNWMKRLEKKRWIQPPSGHTNVFVDSNFVILDNISGSKSSSLFISSTAVSALLHLSAQCQPQPPEKKNDFHMSHHVLWRFIFFVVFASQVCSHVGMFSFFFFSLSEMRQAFEHLFIQLSI